MHQVRKLKGLAGQRKLGKAHNYKTPQDCCRYIHTGKVKTVNISGEPDTRERVSPVRGRVFENLMPKGGKASDA